MDTFLIDFDGTLCDTRPAIRQSLLELFQQSDRSIPDGLDILSLISSGNTLQETLLALGIPERLVPEWVSAYRRLYTQHERHARLFDGVADTLNTLKSKGRRLVLLSNKGRVAVEGSLQTLGIGQYFDLILAEQPGLPGKPDPSVFTLRIAPHYPALLPSECVMVGDTPADLQFAQAIGSLACFAAYGYGQEDACRAIGYDFRLQQFADLLAI